MDNGYLFGCSPRCNQNYGKAFFQTKSLGWLWKRSKGIFKVIECICGILCSLPHFCPPLAVCLRSQSTCKSGRRTASRSASLAGLCTSSHWAPGWVWCLHFQQLEMLTADSSFYPGCWAPGKEYVQANTCAAEHRRRAHHSSCCWSW